MKLPLITSPHLIQFNMPELSGISSEKDLLVGFQPLVKDTFSLNKHFSVLRFGGSDYDSEDAQENAPKKRKRWERDAQGLSLNPNAVAKRKAKSEAEPPGGWGKDEQERSLNPNSVARRKAKREAKPPGGWGKDEQGRSLNPDAVRISKARKEAEPPGGWGKNEQGLSLNPISVARRKKENQIKSLNKRLADLKDKQLQGKFNEEFLQCGIAKLTEELNELKVIDSVLS